MEIRRLVYKGWNKGTTVNNKNMRRVGRPNLNLARARRFHSRKRLKQRLGVDIIQILEDKGYYVVRKKGESSSVRVSKPIEREHDKPVLHENAFLAMEAEDVLKSIVLNLLRGVEVPGFALIPEEKVEGNTTVDKVVVANFPPGHPAYRSSLVALKTNYAR